MLTAQGMSQWQVWILGKMPNTPITSSIFMPPFLTLCGSAQNHAILIVTRGWTIFFVIPMGLLAKPMWQIGICHKRWWIANSWFLQWTQNIHDIWNIALYYYVEVWIIIVHDYVVFENNLNNFLNEKITKTLVTMLWKHFWVIDIH